MKPQVKFKHPPVLSWGGKVEPWRRDILSRACNDNYDCK